jgi:hypothetical protein
MIVPVSLLPDERAVYPFDDRNFFLNQKAIDNLATRLKPNTVCELGAMLGASARHWAKYANQVFSVDHWDWKRFEDLGQSIDDPPYDPAWNTWYERFVANCYHSQLENKIFTLRATTVEAAEYCRSNNLHFDIVYIDAEHSTESVKRDIDLWLPLCDTLCGDDFEWMQEPRDVRAAVIFKANQYGYSITSEGNFWYYEKKE